MTTPSTYPSGLPGPSQGPIQANDRRLKTEGSGPLLIRALQRQYIGTQTLEWVLTDTQAETFYQWWYVTLTSGGAWFTAPWAFPKGTDYPVDRRFLAPPEWTHIPGGSWRVAATCEVRTLYLGVSPVFGRGYGGRIIHERWWWGAETPPAAEPPAYLLFDTFDGSAGGLEGIPPTQAPAGLVWHQSYGVGAKTGAGYYQCTVTSSDFEELYFEASPGIDQTTTLEGARVFETTYYKPVDAAYTNDIIFRAILRDNANDGYGGDYLYEVQLRLNGGAYTQYTLRTIVAPAFSDTEDTYYNGSSLELTSGVEYVFRLELRDSGVTFKIDGVTKLSHAVDLTGVRSNWSSGYLFEADRLRNGYIMVSDDVDAVAP